MKSEIGVGIIGFGTVGTGVARILLDNASLIRRRLGVPITLVGVADLDVTRDRGIKLPAGLMTPNCNEILDNPRVDVVVELIGGYDAAKRVLLDAMANGKDPFLGLIEGAHNRQQLLVMAQILRGATA